MINAHKETKRNSNRPVELRIISPAYIAGLERPFELAFKNVLYHPRFIDADCSKNNSTRHSFGPPRPRAQHVEAAPLEKLHRDRRRAS